jgi:hypothetical protein
MGKTEVEAGSPKSEDGSRKTEVGSKKIKDKSRNKVRSLTEASGKKDKRIKNLQLKYILR